MPPADYYLANLQRVVDWVERHHAALLDAPALGFVSRLRSQPLPAQRLYVRLLMRRGPWFRIDRLEYREVGPIRQAALALCLGGLAEFAGAVRWRERLDLLRKDELARLLAGRMPAAWIRSARRSECLAACEALEEGAMADLPEAMALLRTEQVDCLRLLFFGNARQHLTEFILADLGILRFAQVPLEPLLPWRDPGDVRRDLRCLDAAEHLSALEAGAGQAPDAAELEALEEDLCRPATAPRVEARRNRALLRLARCWRLRGDELHALGVLGHASGAPAREARCRLLAASGAVAAAVELQATLAAAPDGDVEAQFAERFDAATGRCRPRRRHGDYPHRRMILCRTDPAERIEQVVIRTLAHGGGQAMHVENALVGLLVGLAFWDIVFAPLPGAFVQPFQSAPLDLFERGFRSRRADAIDARLSALASGRVDTADLLATWHEHFGTVNALVPWQRFSCHDVRRLLEVLPPPLRAWLCDRALSQASLLRRGFPDLVLLGDAPGCFTFIEVKGPGDVLRPEQRKWFDALASAGLPAHVLEVRWA